MINHVSAKLLTTLIRCQRINNFANTVSGYWLTMMTQKILQNCFSMFIWGLVLKISLHFRCKKKIVKRKKMIFNLCNSLSSQKQKRFAKPFLPVQMGLRSNLLSKNLKKKIIKFFFFNCGNFGLELFRLSDILIRTDKYPASVSIWGLSSTIDAVFTWDNGQTYFFSQVNTIAKVVVSLNKSK